MLTKLTKPSVCVNLVGPQVSLQIGWAPAIMGSTHYFLLNKEALPSVPKYGWWVRTVIGRIHSFWRNKEVLACVRPWTMWVPTVSLSMYIPLPMLSFVENVDHAVPRTPARRTTERPTKGMTRRQRSHISGGMWVSTVMAWPAVGVVAGGEACAAAQPATRGGSRWSRQRWIW